jgi:hypothetical protein
MPVQEERRKSLVRDMDALTAKNAKLLDAVQARSAEIDTLQEIAVLSTAHCS